MIRRLSVFIIFFFILMGPVAAQEVDLPAEELVSTESATTSGIVEKVVEKKPDITEPTGEVKTKLEKVLEENPVESLKWHNFLRYMTFKAVKNGVPVNTIVLILLFPVIVASVAASRHLVGIRGLGIFTPALLSVAFLATGMVTGVMMFVVILAVATLTRMFLRKLKLQYLPRMALLLWFVSLGLFGALYGATFVSLTDLVTVGIFPILILMLLAETFIDVQVGRSVNEAMSLISSTFILAIATSFVMGLDIVQKWVLLYTEIIFFGVAIFDLFMGRYTGLRFLEYLKFRSLSEDGDDEE